MVICGRRILFDGKVVSRAVVDSVRRWADERQGSTH